jgi:hypothetical protein
MISFFLVLSLQAAPNATLTTHGVKETTLTDDALRAVIDGRMPSVITASHFSAKPLTVLSGSARAELVTAGLSVVKAFLSSKAAHRAFGESKAGDAPQDPLTLAKEMEAQLAVAKRAHAEQVANAPVDQKATLAKAFAESDKATAELAAELKTQAAEQAQFTKAALDEWTKRCDEEGRGLEPKLRALLMTFLAETEHMPFDAKLKGRQFADAKLEAKPGWWKACWRAGQAPVEAARAFAKKWVAELK